MIPQAIRNSKVYAALKALKQFLKTVDIKMIYFILPTLFALIAAGLEGFSFGLLVPTIKGIIEKKFEFMNHMPFLGSVVNDFPKWFGPGNTPIFIFLVVLIFMAAIIKNVFQYASSVSVVFLSNRFSNNLRKLIYNRYLSFGKLYFDQQNAGYLYNVLIGFSNQIAGELQILQGTFSSVFMLLIYLALMLTISWQMTLITLMLFPLLHYALDWLIKKIRTTSQLYADASISLSGKISNALSCIPLVKAYTREKKESEWFSFASDRLASFELSLAKKYTLIGPIQEIVTLSMMLILVSSMAFLVIKEKSGQLAGYFVFFVLLRRSAGNFGVFDNINAAFGRASGAALEIMKIFNDQEKHFVPEGSSELVEFKHGIEFCRLSYSYPNRTEVLRNISFNVKKGEATAIVGPSGAGKTTMINMLLRFYDSAPDMIKIDGTDIRKFTLKSLRSKMALVSQETLLFNATLRMNLIYGLDGEISNGRILEVAEKARLYELIVKLPKGLQTEIGDRGVKLSGGEKQRVSIARAMLKGAEILILDEATSSLDSRTENMIQEAINEVIRNRTAIVIAHRLSTIKHADKIVVIEDGQIVEQGKVDELIAKKGKFYLYWQEQKFN